MNLIMMQVVLDATPFFGFPNPRGIGTYVVNLSSEMRKLIRLSLAFRIERITRPEARKRYKKLRDISPMVFILGHNFLIPPKKRYIFHGTDLFLLKNATKKVLTLHDLYYFKGNITELSPEFVGKKKNKIRSLLYDFNPDAVITPSHFIKAEVLSYFPHLEGRVWVVYHGVSATFYPREACVVKKSLTRFGLSYKNYLIFVGFADQRKNFENLLKAMESVDIPLVVAGTQFDYLKSHYPISENHLLTGKLRVFTRLDEEDLADLYNGAIALVFPSLYEGFGLPLIEAMASGTPSLVSKIGTFEEIAGDAALYCDPEDPEDIRDKILKISSDSDLQDRMKRRGVLLAKRFSWEKAARETVEIYKKIF